MTKTISNIKAEFVNVLKQHLKRHTQKKLDTGMAATLNEGGQSTRMSRSVPTRSVFLCVIMVNLVYITVHFIISGSWIFTSVVEEWVKEGYFQQNI